MAGPLIIGHESLVRLLDRAIVDDRLRHAYLFQGPARVGRSAVARWLGMRLVCSSANAPCGTCADCRRVSRGTHSGLRSIQAPGARDESVGLPIEAQSERSGRAAERAISIELVRALQHDASLAASGSERRLFVVSGAESLSLPAANALLKTIEEPPPHVVIVLTASDSYDLLPTIVSRCQLIRFALVPPAEIASGLVRLELATGERADLLSRLSGGRPGWAIAAAKSPDLLADRDKAIEDLSASTARSFRERLGLGEKLATTFSRDQGAIYQTLSLWQVWWWDVYLAQSGCSDLVTNVDRLDRIRDLARVVAPQRVVTYLGELNLASTRLAQNVNPRLALATLLLSSPNVDA